MVGWFMDQGKKGVCIGKKGALWPYITYKEEGLLPQRVFIIVSDSVKSYKILNKLNTFNHIPLQISCCY